MKEDLILVDTSAWIDSFKDRLPLDLKTFLIDAINTGKIATSRIIILELLQGCKTIKEKRTLQERMQSLEVLPLTPDVWSRSYHLGFSLRKKGITVPTVDVIVASTAIEHSCLLLHNDRHFELIARNFSLKTSTW